MWSYYSIYTFLNTVSAAPNWVPASFLSKVILRLAFASALLMCVFQVCLLSKVIPRYVALSVCCNSVSSNIIFMGFDLFDRVKSVLKDLVLFIFTQQSCAQLDKMLIASWSNILAVVAYYYVLHRTKSSAYMTPPSGTPCLRSIFLLFVLYMTTLALRLCRHDLIHPNIFLVMLHFFSFRSRPSVQTVSNAFCRPIHTVSVCFLCWNPSSISCAKICSLILSAMMFSETGLL